jgi:hypothetical protein
MAMLVTISTNIPALRLYQSVGFAPVDVSESPRYEKQISSDPTIPDRLDGPEEAGCETI